MHDPIVAETEDAAWQTEVARVAAAVRRKSLEISIRRNGGYLSQACGIADVLATLYVYAMDLGPPTTVAASWFQTSPPLPSTAPWGGNWNGWGRASSDRFILSPAHYSMALYATLSEVGRLPASALESFGEDGSSLEMIGGEFSPGLEMTSGSLAQGLSVGIGRALARSASGTPGHIWVLISDGELQEGQTWEALQLAGHRKLENLTVVLDANGLQVDGPVAGIVGIEPIARKVAAFGWSVDEIDGHDIPALGAALSIRSVGQPRLIVARTTPWQGLPFLESRFPNALHFIRFRTDELTMANAELGRPPVDP